MMCNISKFLSEWCWKTNEASHSHWSRTQVSYSLCCYGCWTKCPFSFNLTQLANTWVDSHPYWIADQICKYMGKIWLDEASPVYVLQHRTKRSQVLVWWMKKSFHFTNIWSIITKLVAVCSVYQTPIFSLQPLYMAKLAYLGMLFIVELARIVQK